MRRRFWLSSGSFFLDETFYAALVPLLVGLLVVPTAAAALTPAVLAARHRQRQGCPVGT